jgi:protein-S-isoprenylcysteine O-methyltransferase Ste14
MNSNISVAGEIAWVLGIVAWYVIRYPFERRARRVPVVRDRHSLSDRLGLFAALFGLAILPGLYVATGYPSWADYPARWWAVAAGALTFVCALWVFRRSHKDLGRNWSITLEIRQKHKLVSTGLYAWIRHPMYTSFMLMGLGQALLLSNWIAGFSGLAGFFILFSLRVGKEERMMLDSFGEQYRAYMLKTKRIIPYLY